MHVLHKPDQHFGQHDGFGEVYAWKINYGKLDGVKFFCFFFRIDLRPATILRPYQVSYTHSSLSCSYHQSVGVAVYIGRKRV